MNKTDIIRKITYDTGIQHEAVKLILESAALIVRDAILRGERVVFVGFGSFMPRIRKEKKGQDIRHGSTVHIPARMGVKFIPCKTIKSGLNRPPKEDQEE